MRVRGLSLAPSGGGPCGEGMASRTLGGIAPTGSGGPSTWAAIREVTIAPYCSVWLWGLMSAWYGHS